MKEKFFILSSFFALINFCCKREISCENCIQNKPPIAIAGPDQVITLPTDSISLDGSNSKDPDGTISEWLWQKISGPASFDIKNSSTAKTTVKDLSKGIYQFELKVTDDKNLSAKDTVQIIVNDPVQPANRPPLANTGADQVLILPTNTASLNGAASTDPDNNITAYHWTKISGPALFSISNANAVQTQATNLSVGEYKFELMVTDAGGLFSKDTMRVIVLDTTGSNTQVSYEIILRLPIDSAFIDDYYRDTEGTCVVFMSGPGNYTINGGWVKDLVPGVYFFRRYWINCITPAEIIKVTVLNDPNEVNTITYKNLVWEYNCAYANNYNPGCQHLFLSRPAWPNYANPPIEVHLQMDSVNNGQWFSVPSNTDGYNFWLNCGFTPNNCLHSFFVTGGPANSSWDGKNANLKIKIF